MFASGNYCLPLRLVPSVWCVMFIGEYRCKLDAKGRVLFPAVLRRQNEAEEKGAYVLKRGVYERHLVLYTLDDFRRQAEAVRERVDRYSREGDRFVREFYRANEMVTLDSSDRILLSKRHLEFLGAESDLVFVGQMDTIEIWDVATYEQLQLSGEDYAQLTERILGTKNAEG